MLRIVTYPHPALRYTSRPVTQIDDDLRATVREMFDLMYEATGIGLAANQVGAAVPVLHPEPDGRPRAEGPGAGLHQPRDRQAALVDRGRGGLPELPGPLLQGPPGQEDQGPGLRPRRASPIELEAEELFSRAIQHETDHLDGKLFIDYLGPLARHSATAKLREFETAVPPGPGRRRVSRRRRDRPAARRTTGLDAAGSPPRSRRSTAADGRLIARPDGERASP